MTSKAPWIICPTCNGDGSHSRALGAFTMSEFQDQFSPDEQGAYFAGEYDSPCQTCGTAGKIRADDEHAAHQHEQQIWQDRGFNDAGEPLF